MNKEGNICMAMEEWAVREQVPVLTILDSFICPTSTVHKPDKVIGIHFGEMFGARCLTKGTTLTFSLLDSKDS